MRASNVLRHSSNGPEEKRVFYLISSHMSPCVYQITLSPFSVAARSFFEPAHGRQDSTHTCQTLTTSWSMHTASSKNPPKNSYASFRAFRGNMTPKRTRAITSTGRESGDPLILSSLPLD